MRNTFFNSDSLLIYQSPLNPDVLDGLKVQPPPFFSPLPPLQYLYTQGTGSYILIMHKAVYMYVYALSNTDSELVTKQASPEEADTQTAKHVGYFNVTSLFDMLYIHHCFYM